MRSMAALLLTLLLANTLAYASSPDVAETARLLTIVCHPTCANCTGTLATHCDTCPPGRFKNTTTGACTACNIACATCSATNQCLTCPVRRFISGTSCPPCHNTCWTCSNNQATGCLTCQTTAPVRYLTTAGAC